MATSYSTEQWFPMYKAISGTCWQWRPNPSVHVLIGLLTKYWLLLISALPGVCPTLWEGVDVLGQNTCLAYWSSQAQSLYLQNQEFQIWNETFLTRRSILVSYEDSWFRKHSEDHLENVEWADSYMYTGWGADKVVMETPPYGGQEDNIVWCSYMIVCARYSCCNTDQPLQYLHYYNWEAVVLKSILLRWNNIHFLDLIDSTIEIEKL